MTDGSCAACGRTIDESARLCPFCGANPQTGERVDTEQLLQEVFGKPQETKRGVVEFARQRQGVVVAISALVVLLLIGGLHQLATMRNATAVNDSPAIPLSELTDVANSTAQQAVPMPDLDFQYDGRPRAMRTYVVEPGAIAPAPPASPASAATATPSPAAGSRTMPPRTAAPSPRPAPSTPPG